MLSPVENEGVIAARLFQTHADNVKINHQLRAYRPTVRTTGGTPDGFFDGGFANKTARLVTVAAAPLDARLDLTVGMPSSPGLRIMRVAGGSVAGGAGPHLPRLRR